MWNAVILFRLLVGAARLPGAVAAARLAAVRRHGRGAAVRARADVHALGAAGVDVGRGRGAVAAGGDPGAGAPAGAGCGSRRLRCSTAAAAYGGQPEVLACLAYLGAGWGAYWWWREGRSTRRAGGARGGRGVRRAAARRPQVVPTLEYLRIAADSHGGQLGHTRLALSDLDALVRRKGLQPELLGWPLALAAVAGAIGWRRRIAGTGPLLVAAGVWALRSLDTPLAPLLAWLPGLDRVNVPRYGEFVLGLAAAALAAAALARISRPSLALGARRHGRARRRSGCCTRRASSPCRSTRSGRCRRWPPSGATCEPGQRLAAIGRNVRPQMPSALAIADPRAEDALYPERYARLRGAARRRRAVRVPVRARRLQTAGLDLVDAVGVRYVAASPGSAAPAGMQPVPTRARRPRRVRQRGRVPARVHACRPLPSPPRRTRPRPALAGPERLRDRSVIEQPTDAMRAATGTATATVAAIGWDTERLQVTSEGAAVLVVASQVFPGWEATVDGQPTPIRPANLAMRADRGPRRHARGRVPLPAGLVPARARCWRWWGCSRSSRGVSRRRPAPSYTRAVTRRFAAAYLLLLLLAGTSMVATAAVARHDRSRARRSPRGGDRGLPGGGHRARAGRETALGHGLPPRTGRPRRPVRAVRGRRRRHSGSISVLAGARLPAGTGLVRFNELEVANVTVRSALWRPGGSGDAAVRAAVDRLR